MNEQAAACCFAVEKPGLVFLEADAVGLQVTAGLDDQRAFRRYMVCMLRRHPQNLKRHVQYIMTLLNAERRDVEAIFAALLDLFIVLEGKGLPLRRRMLAMARPFLSHEDFAFLHSQLQSGITAFTPLRQGNRSALTRACAGELNFIRRIDVRENSAFASLYDEAISLIEYGEVKEAQTLLEQALRMQPDDEKTAAELVAIYQHRNDATALACMSQWFMSNNLPLPACWPLL